LDSHFSLPWEFFGATGFSRATVCHEMGMRELKHMPANPITGANAGERLGFAEKSRVVQGHRSGVAQFFR